MVFLFILAEKEGYTDGTSTRNGQRDITGFISSRNIRCKDDSSSGSCHKSKQTRKRSVEQHHFQDKLCRLLSSDENDNRPFPKYI